MQQEPHGATFHTPPVADNESGVRISRVTTHRSTITPFSERGAPVTTPAHRKHHDRLDELRKLNREAEA
ncbi:MAG: hypothetical protein WAM23_12930, partial [Candidatus Acidiferrales bacterium]